MTVPVYLPYYVLAGSVAIVAVILLGLRRALIMAGWSSHDRRRAARISAVVLIGWFGAAIALGWLGVYRGVADRIPTIQYGILMPILIGSWLIYRSSTVARVLDVVPQQWLIGVQLYRALGIIFLILYGAGKLPGLFAWPAGLGDVLVGVLAPVVAIAYARGPRENRDLVSAWNIFGIVDLIVAVAISAFRLRPAQRTHQRVSAGLGSDLPRTGFSAAPSGVIGKAAASRPASGRPTTRFSTARRPSLIVKERTSCAWCWERIQYFAPSVSYF